MSRHISAAVESISQLPQIRYRLLVDVESTSTGTTRACSGLQYVYAFGNTYSPIGTLGGIDKIQEEADVFPRAVRLWFSAVNSAQIQDVLNESLFNCPVKIYSTFLTDSLTCVSTPEQRFGGYINTVDMKIKDSQRGDYFEIEVESRLMRPPRAQYFNKETLWTFYSQSGDTFFDYVSKIPFEKAKWGLAQGADYSHNAQGEPGHWEQNGRARHFVRD